jgi:chemotaxis protein MotA
MSPLMFAIIGIVVVFGSILGGYLLEHGKLAVLLQPAELVIIFGAAVGTVLVANPLPVLIKIGKGIAGVFASSPFTKEFYLENIKMLNELFQLARKQGLMKLESDVEEPDKSAIFSKYPKFLKHHHALYFVCDTLRMSISGGIGAFDLDQMMESDLEVHHQEANAPVEALTKMADSLPGLGIVAAVLGVVITMGALGGPPEEIGHKVAAALVGTFLGILLCYGLFGPLAANMAKSNEAEHEYLQFLRVAVISSVKGFAPLMAIEFARRVIPAQIRPHDQLGGPAAAPERAAGRRGGEAHRAPPRHRPVLVQHRGVPCRLPEYLTSTALIAKEDRPTGAFTSATGPPPNKGFPLKVDSSHPGQDTRDTLATRGGRGLWRVLSRRRQDGQS